MEKGFLDKVEDSAAVRIWSEKTRQKKGDSLTEGYMSELWDFTRISVTQNNLQELKEVEKVSYRVFFETYSPLKEFVATSRREKWMAILQCLQDEDVEWRAHWMIPNEILYQCGDFDWVLLLGIWGATRYAPLLVLR
ncbi:hypothetical protein Gotri_000573 [Gossypium trilobum]|uniref:DUF7745 domain-containing protein n=4 Tax=Gossypium TaxID=3633 RepID=A0A7J9FBT4_9ROSI|nr:hypothetical protein [Gossypium trilobum]